MNITGHALLIAAANVALLPVSVFADTSGPQYLPDSAPEATQATIYVFRSTNLLVNGRSFFVLVNGVPTAELPGHGYFVLHVAPGPVELSAFNKTLAIVHTSAGQTYYVKAWIELGLINPPAHMEIVTNDVGKTEIAACDPVPPSAWITSGAQLETVELPTSTHSGSVMTYVGVEWMPGIHDDAGGDIFYVTLVLAEESVILRWTKPEGVTAPGHDIRIPYTDIASVEGHHWKHDIEAIRLKLHTGREDELRFTRSGQVDSVADLLRSKVQGRSGEQTLADAGEVIAKYDSYTLVETNGPDCRFPGFQHFKTGNSFEVRDHILVWGQNGHVPDVLPIDDIQEALPLQRFGGFDWLIPLKRRDGSCLFFRMNTKGWQQKAIQDEVRNKIISRMPASAPGVKNGSSP
jgi:hypothetical protein